MKRKKILLSIIVLAAGAITVGLCLNATNVLAATDADVDFYSSFNNMFYERENCSGVIKHASGGSSSGESYGGLSAEQVAFVIDNHDTAQMHSIAYGIPWETVVAQGILESASGTSRLAKDKNNFFGIGAYDSCPYECAFSYASKAEGWEGYYKNIVRTATYRNHGVFQGDTITDPYIYAQAIKNAGYATDPDYVTKLHKLISGIEEVAAREGWMSSSELAAAYPEMIEHAAVNAQGLNVEVDLSGTPGGGSRICKGDDSTEGGTTFADLDGVRYAFPIQFASKASVRGYVSDLPCNHSIGCHYGPGNPSDPPQAAAAFDLCFRGDSGRSCVGAPIVSVADGYITRVTYERNGAQCNHVRIRSHADNYIIAYLHLAYEPSIVSGVEVKAGDVIGHVSGVGPCHDNSVPHLHIDMGSDTTATGGPERKDRNSKIVSIINATFNALPENEKELQDRMRASGLTGGLTNEQAQKLVAHYKSADVTASAWNLPSDHGKWNCSSLSAYFLQRFTSVGHRTGGWWHGRDFSYGVKSVNSSITTGKEPKPFAIFSVTAGTTKDEDGIPYGHTGVVLRVDGDMVTFIEAAYSVPNYTGIQTKPLSYFVNTKHPNDVFAYLDDIMDISELKSIVGD